MSKNVFKKDIEKVQYENNQQVAFSMAIAKAMGLDDSDIEKAHLYGVSWWSVGAFKIVTHKFDWHSTPLLVAKIRLATMGGHVEQFCSPQDPNNVINAIKEYKKENK